MTNEQKIANKRRFFPEERMHVNFPWMFWAIGWLAILKAFIWLATDPNGDQFILFIVGIKYAVLMVPFLIGGIALWRLKKWAVWTMVVLCCLELFFYLLFPVSLRTLVVDHTSPVAWFLTFLVFINNGPISDILILIACPFMFQVLAQRS